MTQKAKFVILDKVPSQMMDNLEILTCNLTTSNQKSYELIQKLYVNKEEEFINMKYGTGSLAFIGQSNKNQTKFFGKLIKNSSTSYLIRAKGKESFELLNTIIKGNSKELVDCKISSLEAHFAISLSNSTNIENLVEECFNLNRNISKRTKLAKDSNNSLVIGSPSSTKFIKLGISKDFSNSKKKCLFGVIRTKELEPKHVKFIDLKNLGLEDLSALTLRNIFSLFEDCELRDLILSFIKSNFSLPSAEKLKGASAQNSKIKYVQGALQTIFKYYEIENLKEEIIAIVNNFQMEWNLKVKKLENIEKNEGKK